MNKSMDYAIGPNPRFVPYILGFVGSVLLLVAQLLCLVFGGVPALPVVTAVDVPSNYSISADSANPRIERVTIHSASCLQWLPYSWSEEKVYVRSQMLSQEGYELGERYWIDMSDRSIVPDPSALETAYQKYRARQSQTPDVSQLLGPWDKN